MYNFNGSEFIKFPDSRDAPDTVFAGYPASLKAGYRISGRIFVLTDMFLVKYKISFFKKL
jgi:hypothetical protein